MVTVAQLVESRIVIPVVAGSSPVSHPTPTAREKFLPFCSAKDGGRYQRKPSIGLQNPTARCGGECDLL